MQCLHFWTKVSLCQKSILIMVFESSSCLGRDLSCHDIYCFGSTCHQPVSVKSIFHWHLYLSKNWIWEMLRLDCWNVSGLLAFLQSNKDVITFAKSIGHTCNYCYIIMGIVWQQKAICCIIICEYKTETNTYPKHWDKTVSMHLWYFFL